mmetsp:Transcript_7598/g.18804  ORF Transcript_7598/g.18804 Transcript_7598/m.18804 type:complete len:359 (-) Transcript_7598:38-1114(-)
MLRGDEGSCHGEVAVLVVGEFRELAQTGRWKSLPWSVSTAFEQLVNATLQIAAPMSSDVFVETWDNNFSRQALGLRMPGDEIGFDHYANMRGTMCTNGLCDFRTALCQVRLEAYNETYALRLVSQYQWLRIIGGFLRIEDKRETPHIVDFFYKRYQALKLIEEVEARRGRAYTAILMTRPDIIVTSNGSALPIPMRPRTIYVVGSDDRPDSNSTHPFRKPSSLGLCGQMPNDMFAVGDRLSMGRYLNTLPSLRNIHDEMLRTPGHCYWWKCHNHRHNRTFLMNAEAYLGFHLRREGLGCQDLQKAKNYVHIHLPRNRVRAWKSKEGSSRGSPFAAFDANPRNETAPRVGTSTKSKKQS